MRYDSYLKFDIYWHFFIFLLVYLHFDLGHYFVRLISRLNKIVWTLYVCMYTYTAFVRKSVSNHRAS
jgi:hypothetical protein